MRIGSGISPHSSGVPASGLQFAQGTRTGTQFDVADTRASRVSDDNRIQLHLGNGTQSNELDSSSDGEKPGSGGKEHRGESPEKEQV